MPMIHLYADGSFCPDTKAAGGAFVIKCGGVMIRDRFELKDVSDSWEAEILTYGYALQRMKQHPQLCKMLHDKTRLIAVLDCQGVETFILSSKEKSNKGRVFPPSVLSVREIHNAMMNYLGITPTFIHVRAHTNDATVAAYWNSKVDDDARACMENMRKRLK